MPSQIARIEVYPAYDSEGAMDLEMPFAYGCSELNLMGYSNVEELIEDIRIKLIDAGGKRT